MIYLPKYIYTECLERARRESPVESCGIFGGIGDCITAYYAMTNIDRSPEHFSMDPKQQFAVIKDLRRRGLKQTGVVHSHPATPARLSEEDKRLSADPDAVYFILSLAKAEPEMKAFRNTGDGTFEAVPITIVEGHSPNQFILPATVIEDVKAFRHRVQKYLDGREDAIRFRAYRVPMGFYEQRQEETFMARVRITAGVLTTRQLRALAAATDRYGDGGLHLTTRQDIQIHDVLMPNAPDLVDLLLDAGLVCRGGGGNTVRNVTADPLAGAARDEPFDVTPYAVAATEYLIRSRSSFHLPRKFKIAFSASDADRALTLVADLGFLARLRDGKPGFTVFAGGGMGAASRLSVRITDFLPAENLCYMLEAVKRVFDRHGDRLNRSHARLRFVLERFGEAKFISIIRKEFDHVMNEGIETVEPRFLFVRDFTGEEINRPEPFVTPQNVPGLYAVTLHPQWGDISSGTARALAEIVETSRLELRVAHGQRLVLRSIRGQDFDAVLNRLKELQEQLIETVPSRNPVVCTGASTCKLGLCLSRNLAAELHGVLEALPDDAAAVLPKLFISGCPNACGQHPIGELSFSGHAKRHDKHLVPYYKVWAGSRRGEDRSLAHVIGAIPARAVPDFVRELALTLKARRKGDESFPDLVEQDEYAQLKALLKTYHHLPSYEDNPLFYRDFGQDSDFSLAGRGPGECGAGVMDVIQVDIRHAKDQFKTYRKSHHDPALYQSALSAMRSLLILRGVDSQKDREIMEAFRKYFIKEGWVDAASADLIDQLLDFKLGDRSSIADCAGAVESLIKRVDALYRSLDSSLNFTIEPAATASAAEEKTPEAHLADLRGVACPMNYVKAKLQLEKISIGEILEIILDDGEPVRNVPASFSNDGQEVIDIHPYDSEHFKVRVKRVR